MSRHACDDCRLRAFADDIHLTRHRVRQDQGPRRGDVPGIPRRWARDEDPLLECATETVTGAARFTGRPVGERADRPSEGSAPPALP